ncbi:hypothetical protein V5799_008443 [Amblyomma americanum]|uniref:Ig-like domain-containing protein n=1 Tax=Amblyomma americanum TaxID=6943 RepID=A0AAQ4FEQ2_AMBAM
MKCSCPRRLLSEAPSSPSAHCLSSSGVAVAPVQALLVRRGPLVAGVTAELECVAWGSRPEASLRWSLGGRPLASAFTHWDGRNVSTATVTLRPAPADHGRRLVCAASNPRTPAIPAVQDSRRLDVHSVIVAAMAWKSILQVEENGSIMFTTETFLFGTLRRPA